MKYIILTQGRRAIVDEQDYDNLKSYKWYLHASGYGCRKIRLEDGRRHTIFIHKEVNKTPLGLYTDHINGDKLDNQRANLRTVDRMRNRINSKPNKNSISGYKGVHVRKRYRSTYYEVDICVNRVTIFIGYFRELDKAVAAYQKAAHHYHGEYARFT